MSEIGHDFPESAAQRWWDFRAQAEIEPEGPRAHARGRESRRIFDEIDRLAK